MNGIIRDFEFSNTYKEQLNQSNYFHSLMEIASKAGVLSQEDLLSIQRQLFNLLREVTLKYTSGDSSSVTVERANQLLANISYKIGLCLKGQRGVEEAVFLLKECPAAILYQKGEGIAKRRVVLARRLLDKTREIQMTTKNIAYHDTLGEGLQEFFYYYDYRFEANMSPGMVDYPLNMKHPELSGIEFVHEYLQGFYMENQFCMNFDTKVQENIFRGYDKGYDELLINLFEHTLANALGCTLCHKPPQVLDIWGEDYECITNRLRGLGLKQIKALLGEQLDFLFEALEIRNSKMKEHAILYLEGISSRVQLCLNLNKLPLVFIGGISKEGNN